MPSGVYYFPEQCPQKEWSRDFGRMAKMGFEFVNIGVFEWAEMEPQADKFDFRWLDTCIRKASENGLKIILTTPNAVPPAWLTKLHPEMLRVTEKGDTISEETFLQVNQTNELFENFATRVIRELAKKYGKDKRIIGWQIGNEPHIGSLFDYSETSQKGFRKWLIRKYNKISNLKSSWRISNTDMAYSSFEKIRIPQPGFSYAVIMEALLDFHRYTMDAIVSMVQYQSIALKPNINRSQWLTANFAAIKYLPLIVPSKNSRDIDLFAHTTGLADVESSNSSKDMNPQGSKGLLFSLSSELAKSVKGSSAIFELQQKEEIAVRRSTKLEVWHAYSLGEKLACTYLYRDLQEGTGISFRSITQSSALAVTQDGSEYIQAMEEIKGLRKHYSKDFTIPSEIVSRKTAFLWKPENFLNIPFNALRVNTSVWQEYQVFYNVCKTAGATVSFLTENDDLNPNEFPFLIVPACQLLDSSLIIGWTKYVRDGGNLVLSSGSGIRNDAGGIPEARWIQKFQQLVGAEIRYSVESHSGKLIKVFFSDSIYLCSDKIDTLLPNPGVKVLAEYQDSVLGKRPAIITSKLGKGTVTYIAVTGINGALEKQILRKIYIDNGAHILKNPNNVFTEFRDGFWITVNYSAKAFDVSVPSKSQILLGTKRLLPGGVLVWKD